MATTQALDNRRTNKHLAKAARRAKYEARADREREVSTRMTKRYIDPDIIARHWLLFADYRYWQARACGWDVLRAEWRTNAMGEPVEPMDGIVWWWWTHLHPKTRDFIQGVARIKRGMKRS